MNKKDKLRRLKHLMYKHHPPFTSMAEYEKRNQETLEFYQTHNLNKSGHEALLELLEICKLSKELKIKDTNMGGNELWAKTYVEKIKNRNILRLKPQKEGRDNKGVYVGSGGSNRNKIRYPSKKRSLRVWKKFYEMFPWAAEADGFNGKTSKRMK
jgi:hypothetical protein